MSDRPAMTIAVDLGGKATKQTNKQTSYKSSIGVSKERVKKHSYLCIHDIAEHSGSIGKVLD